MMGLSREQWLRLCFPAALVLLAYGIAIVMPQARQLRTLTASLARAQRPPTGGTPVPSAHAMAHLRADLAAAKREQAAVDAARLGGTGGTRVAAVAVAWRQVIAHLTAADLELIADAPATPTQEARLPAAYRDLLRGDHQSGSVPTVRRVQVLGTWAAMQGCLSQWQSDALVAVPLALKGTNRRDDGRLEWELLIWL